MTENEAGVPGFTPLGRKKLVITAADLEERRENRFSQPDPQEAVDLTTTDTTHPLQRPDIGAYIEREFPEYQEKIDRVVIPKLSQQPDELEEWERARILKRRDRTYESEMGYLARALYEEAFGVNQDPGKPDSRTIMFQNMPGMTPGGLISHFYTNTQYNQMTVPEYAATIQEIKTIAGTYPKTLAELVKLMREAINSQAVKYDFGRVSAMIGYTKFISDPGTLDVGTAGNWNSRMPGSRYPQFRLEEQLFKGEELTTFLELNSVGLRLGKMLAAEPEFLQLVEDEELKKKFGFTVEERVRKVGLWQVAWQKLSRMFMNPGAIIKPDDDPKKREALELLLYLRTHPETQIFYKYISPSGYINDAQ